MSGRDQEIMQLKSDLRAREREIARLDLRLRLVIKAALGHLDDQGHRAADLIPHDGPKVLWCEHHGAMTRWDSEPMTSLPVCPDCGRDLDAR